MAGPGFPCVVYISKLIFKDVSREFDEFQVSTHLCKLRCWLYWYDTSYQVHCNCVEMSVTRSPNQCDHGAFCCTYEYYCSTYKYFVRTYDVLHVDSEYGAQDARVELYRGQLNSKHGSCHAVRKKAGNTRCNSLGGVVQAQPVTAILRLSDTRPGQRAGTMARRPTRQVLLHKNLERGR